MNTEWNEGGNTVKFPAHVGATVGVDGDDAFFLAFSGETNILTIGSAGAGKNAAAIMPTLLLNQESVFVNDIKGENWWVTHAWREREFGQRIICVNPFNLFGQELGFVQPMTNYHNPLDALRDGPKGLADVTASVTARRQDISPEAAHKRTALVLSKLKVAGMVGREGRLWRLIL